MAAYTFERLIDDSHMIELPKEIPIGWVEITVIPKVDPQVRSEQFAEMMKELLSKPVANPRSPEEIQAYIRHERDSWE